MPFPRLQKPASAALLMMSCAAACATPATPDSAAAPAAAATATSAAPTSAATPTTTTTGRAAAPEELLAAHNRYRAELEIAPLTWSDELAASALAWAKDLVARRKFEHSKTPHGENLWMGTTGAYTQTNMVDNWGEEKEQYVHGVFPKVTKGGVVGHYTQIIWRTTTKVGCGLARGDHGHEVLVCHYDPPGNYYGRSAY